MKDDVTIPTTRQAVASTINTIVLMIDERERERESVYPHIKGEHMSNPAFQQQITAAVSAHGQWKARLATAIKEGKSEFAPAVVRQDNQCAFGKWLYNEIDAASKTDPHYAKVKALHATFHEIGRASCRERV